MNDLQSLRLLTRDEILRRLARLRGAPFVRRPKEITRRDMANWMNVELKQIQMHQSGKMAISDSWQLIYSQFFALIDAGALVLDPDSKKKTLIRVTPAARPAPRLLPHIEFAGDRPRLRLDPS